jgi:RHS repeat-associated protein
VHNPGTLNPLLQIENGEIFVVVLDNNGAPQELVDERGRVAWWARFSEWGKVLDEHSASGVRSPFRLSGHYFDDETGLSYARFRYWDAAHGRWHSPDPLSIQGGLNLFGFDGSPLLDTDPFGLDTALGDQGEALAKNHLRNAAALQAGGANDQGGPFTILGSMQNGSGHGVDIVARDRNGQLVVIEVKVNTSRLSDDQKDGPDAYARDRAARVQNDVASDSGAYKSADANTQKLAQEIANAPGKIRGLVVRVEVDDKGNAKVKKVKEWCNP